MINKKVLQHGNADLKQMIIHWFPTDFCNYNCSYCIAHAPHIQKGIEFTKLLLLIGTVDKIFEIKKDKYVFIFSGGEPTLHPNFIELVEYILENKNASVYLFSNGHKNADFFSKLFSKNNFYLNFSIHLEYANINHVKEIIKCSNNYNKYTMFSLMMNPDLKDKYLQFYKDLYEYRKKYCFGLDLGLIHDNQKLDERYSNEDINWFYKANKEFEEIEKYNNYKGYIPDYFQDYNTKYFFDNNESLYIPHRKAIIKNMKNFKNFYCVQGVNSISINAQGNYKGTECSISPNVGNIYKENIDYFKLIQPIKCSLEGCDCRINNYAPKYINIDKAEKCVNNYVEKILPVYYLYNQIYNLKNDLNKIIDTLAWWIPVRKWRDNFRNKFFDNFIGGGVNNGFKFLYPLNFRLDLNY